MVKMRNLVKVGNREVKKRYVGNKLIFEELGDKTECFSIFLFIFCQFVLVLHFGMFFLKVNQFFKRFENIPYLRNYFWVLFLVF